MHIKHLIITGKKANNHSITSEIRISKGKKIKIRYSMVYDKLLIKLNSGRNIIYKPIKLLQKIGGNIKKITVFNVVVSIFLVRLWIENISENTVNKKIDVYVVNSFHESNEKRAYYYYYKKLKNY